MRPDAGWRWSDGSVECGQREARVEPRCERPTDAAPRERIQDTGKIEERGRQANIRQIGDPRFVELVQRPAQE